MPAAAAQPDPDRTRAGPVRLHLPDAAATEALGRALAAALQPGDTILLEGPIGAGKTHLARALIRARFGPQTEVPSPTFTLVQTYGEGEAAVWHADLYRLSGPGEAAELGLDEALGRAVCLIEWPDRLGEDLPPGALHLRLDPQGEGRIATLSGGRPALRDAATAACAGTLPPAARAEALERFVAAAGWAGATRLPLAGDASARRYLRLARGAATAVLMDAPPGQADDTAAFAAIARHLAALGLSPPRILAEDHPQGFLLLEDLGDALLARLCDADRAREPALYAAAVDVLVHLQRHAPPPALANLTAADWAQAAMLAVSEYAVAAGGDGSGEAELGAALAAALSDLADGPRVLILRDYHAENLLWLPGRAGVARVGLLDFQLAQMGQPAYDLVSLLQDARRDVAPATAAAMAARFAAATGTPPAALADACAVLGVQRALRILGVFTRLCTGAGKPGYLRLVPRVWGHLQAGLAHPALAPVARLCDRLLPPPDAATLSRIAARCPTSPAR